MSRGPYRGKRAVDLVLLALAVIPAVIVVVPCALAIVCTSRGPVFFRQTRVGRDGVPFRLWKLRTMVHGTDPPASAPERDRITRAGRILRRLSLDELPQLLNVAVGSMSVVGPRPTLEYQVERYDARQRGRLSVRPGITGLAQVSGRNELTWAERIDLDLEYVERQSVWLDVGILVHTIPALVRGSGVEGHRPDDPIATREDAT